MTWKKSSLRWIFKNGQHLMHGGERGRLYQVSDRLLPLLSWRGRKRCSGIMGDNHQKMAWGMTVENPE